MNFLIKNKEIKNADDNKIETETNIKKNEFTKTHYQANSKEKEFEVKRIIRKKYSMSNNSFNLNNNNNFIIFRHNSNINITNNNLFINRLDFLDNYSISTRKNNNFSKINNYIKNNNNYINILNRRKLSAKIKNESEYSLLKFIENKDKKKEKDMVNLAKRRPRKLDNEANNLFTETSNLNNYNKNSFFNFGYKKTKNNGIIGTSGNKNGIIHKKLLDNLNSNSKNINEDKNKKYSFINILKPKTISQQKRYTNKNEEKEKEIIQENSKMGRDLKSISFISKDNKNKNEKKKNISLQHNKKIIKLIHMLYELNNSKSKSKSKKNKSYNKKTSKRGASSMKQSNNSQKFKMNDLDKDDRILDNVIQNDFTKYTIYICSKYNDECRNVGLSKIKLYDKNNNEIFIISSKSNINDNDENVNFLFNIKKYYYNNRPFICKFKDNLYINFYVNSKKSNIIKYIKIINYEKQNENISAVKEIKIFHGKKKLFQGILNVNYYNIINISENKNKDFTNYTTTRKKGSSVNINKSNISSNNTYNNNKRNNTRSYSTFRANSGKKNIKIPKRQFIKINSEININSKNLNNKSNYLNYNNTEVENNLKYNKNMIQNICNTIAYNNDFENKKYSRERFISDNFEKENNINILNENRVHEGINLNKFNLNNYNSYNSSNKKEKLNNDLPYIKFKIIRLVLSSNHGNPNFVGLTGLELYDINNQLIDIETAETIGALPKDVHTVYNNENDNRIFENIFNGENNVDDSYNMWVTVFDLSNKKFPYIELSFKKYIYLSKIKLFNYNKKNELDICLKTIDIYLDNKYYNTIYLRQGIGDIINENIIQKENANINLNSEDNNNINDKQTSNNKNRDNRNYCQEIYFPIKNDYYEKITKNKKIKLENEINVQYASLKYEQCYETPYMPNGHIIKFQLISNFYKGKEVENNLFNVNINSSNNLLIKSHNYTGINISKIFDQNGNDLLSQKNIQYKIISNKEMIISDKHNIILNGCSKEDNNNNIYFLFENPVNISYIEINPFLFFGSQLNHNTIEKNYLNNVKELKIFCDTTIIFEGEIYYDQPTIILFTSNEKIIKNINEDYLTKKSVGRKAIENKNENCYSLAFIC